MAARYQRLKRTKGFQIKLPSVSVVHDLPSNNRPNVATQIDIPGHGTIFLGGEADIDNPEIKDVQAIITLAKDPIPEYRQKGIYYKFYRLMDTPDTKINKHFNETYEIIDNNSSIFIHCGVGVSRSATIVLAYLIRKNRWS